MAREINTKKLENKVTELFKARSSEFHNTDDTQYNNINRRLNWARKNLQKAYNWNSKAKCLVLLPVSDCQHVSKNSIGKYVRYETLPEYMYDRIFQAFRPFSGNAYIVDSKFIATNLKDAVAFVELNQ